MLSGLAWVRKCMWVVLNQTKNGTPAWCWRVMNSLAAATNSSSTASMRFFVSGPVFSIRSPPLPADPPADLVTDFREFLRIGIGAQLRLFLGVQVIEVAEELVEAVHGREVLVAVAEVVLAELSRGIAQGLQQLGDGRILGAHAELG